MLSSLEIFIFFLIYGCIGWILDVSYRSITAGRFDIGDGFPLPRWIPVSPIYAIGAFIILTVRPLFVSLPFGLEFVVVTFVLTVFEYASALISERLTGRRLWDYRGRPFNIQGRVCLPQSFAWGALSIVLVYVIHPFLLRVLFGG